MLVAWPAPEARSRRPGGLPRRLPAPALRYEQGGLRVSGMLSHGAGLGGALAMVAQRCRDTTKEM